MPQSSKAMPKGSDTETSSQLARSYRTTLKRTVCPLVWSLAETAKRQCRPHRRPSTGRRPQHWPRRSTRSPSSGARRWSAFRILRTDGIPLFCSTSKAAISAMALSLRCSSFLSALISRWTWARSFLSSFCWAIVSTGLALASSASGTLGLWPR